MNSNRKRQMQADSRKIGRMKERGIIPPSLSDMFDTGQHNFILDVSNGLCLTCGMGRGVVVHYGS